MKIKVVGKAHLSGMSKKTNKPYDFIQVHYLGRARGVEGSAALTVSLDPSLYPYEKTPVPCDAVVEFDNHGYPVEFASVTTSGK